MGCLYKLTSPSGKSYIGITSKSIEARWKAHRYSANKGTATAAGLECEALYNAIRKYGSESFHVELLTVSSDWDTLCQLEREAIITEHTFTPEGYNLTIGGEGSPGAIVSDETRKKQSESQKRIMSDPTFRSVRMTFLSKAVKVRQQKWWNRSAEERKAWGERHSKLVSAGHSTPECKAASSERMKNLWKNPDYRTSNLANRKNQGGKYARTDEWKQAMAERRKREWQDPVMKAKRLAGYAEYQSRRKKQRQIC